MQFTRITAEDKLGYLPIHTSDQHEFRKRYNISTLLFVDVIGLAKQCIVRPIKAKKTELGTAWQPFWAPQVLIILSPQVFFL